MDRDASLAKLSDNVMKLQGELSGHLMDYEGYDPAAALKTSEWATDFLRKYVVKLKQGGGIEPE